MASQQASSEFESYSQEYQQLKQTVQQKLDSDAVKERGEQRKALLRRLTMDIEELDEIVAQMEMEAKGKAKLMIRVRSSKTEITALRARVTSLSALSDRDLLLAQPAHSSYAMDVEDDDLSTSRTAAQRSRLLQSQQTLQGTSGRLDNAERTAAESEAIGGSILGQLRSQRTQLEGANDELEDAQGSISKATVTIKKMVRLAGRQRLILIGFLIVLVGLIFLILFRKLF